MKALIWYRPSHTKTFNTGLSQLPKERKKKKVIIITLDRGGRKCLEQLAVGRETSAHQQAPSSSLKHSRGAPNTKLTKQTIKYHAEREHRLPEGCWLYTLF